MFVEFGEKPQIKTMSIWLGARTLVGAPGHTTRSKEATNGVAESGFDFLRLYHTMRCSQTPGTGVGRKRELEL